jgi:gluconate 5-dehydrogenase
MAESMFDLSGKVALVTGAYRGLGFAIAQGLARAGAHVVLNGRRRTCSSGIKKLQGNNPVRIGSGVRRDRWRWHSCCVAAIEAEHGHLDIPFNNAGIQRRRLPEFPLEQWNEIIAH